MSRARRAGAIAAATGLALALLYSTALGAPTAPLAHSGRWITDARARTVILHGVNMVNKKPPYSPAATGFGDDDAAFLQRNGFDAVRLGLIYKGVEPSPGSYDDGYLDQVAQTEADLARHGVFSQLDFHQDLYNERFQGEGWPDWAIQDDGLPNPQLGFPANYFGNPALIRAFDHFWANDPGPGGVGLQDRYAAAWAHVAARFASAGHTLGFDVMNEPWPGTPFATCLQVNGCPAFDTGRLEPFYRRVLAQIRSVESQKLVWYEPNVLFNFGAETNLPSFGDPSTGFSFHFYCTQGLAVPPTNATNCDAQGERVFTDADRHSQATGDALMLTEFGATDDLSTISQDVRQADEHMVSWQYWHYCECLDPTTTGTGTQAIVIDPNRATTGDNVKQAKLDVLSEPYPQLVAGTPSSYGFDPASGRFQLSYSTRGPTGKNFARRHRKRAKRKRSPGARKARQTQIFLGQEHYPHGYRVSVEGGGIASKPGASLLKVIACPRRRSVTVTVSPPSAGSVSHGDCRVTRHRKQRR